MLQNKMENLPDRAGHVIHVTASLALLPIAQQMWLQ